MDSVTAKIKAEKTIKKTDDFIDAGLISPEKKKNIDRVSQEFSFALTHQLYQSIQQKNEDDPIVKQFVPTESELDISEEELYDPIGDSPYTAVKGIIHRYPDRCLFKPVNVCPVYCRFCFRREKVGPGSETLTHEELEEAYQYIATNEKIWEVILTGGDPLILKPNRLSSILQRLDAINTVGVIRIHTRVPVVDSKRISEDMIKALRLKNKPVYIVLHANHVNEFSSEAREACAQLVDNGIPMLSQSVLLKGINDNIEDLSQLMRCFIQNRIKPYYLHHGDLARGTKHFRTTIDEGQNLMRQLRGHYSGICQPTYVLDIPGGFGKVPIHHSYICQHNGKYVVEDYHGNKHEYSPASEDKS